MIHLSTLFGYLGIIGAIAGLIFICDKFKAKRAKWRVPESTLHLLEALGGVFFIVMLMYVVRHKCNKSSYYIISYIILVFWIVLISLMMHYKYLTV